MAASIKRTRLVFIVLNSLYFYLSITLAFQCYNFFKYDMAFDYLALVAILWGTIIFFVLLTALFGFYSSGQSAPNFFHCYAALVGLGMLLQIALHVMLYLKASDVRPQIIKSELKGYLFHSRGKEEVHPKVLEVQHDIQMLQQNLSCCGHTNFQDYHLDLQHLPNSCCGKYNATIFEKIAGRTVHWCPANIQTGACKEAEVNKEGCGYEFSEKFKNTFFDFNALFILAFIFYAFQVAVMAMAWQLSRKLKIPDDVFQMKFQMTDFE